MAISPTCFRRWRWSSRRSAARLSRADRRRRTYALNLLGAVVISFVLALNLIRIDGIAALAATVLVALYLRQSWIRRVRPGGTSATAGYGQGTGCGRFATLTD